MLALSIAALGEERALAVARTAVGAESLPQVLPYLQDAAVPPRLRAVLQHADVDLDEVRVRFTKDLGAPDQPLIRLRRVTWGSLINVALLAIAAFTLIGLLGDLDLESFLRGAEGRQLVVAGLRRRHRAAAARRLGLQHHGLDRQTAATRAAGRPCSSPSRT